MRSMTSTEVTAPAPGDRRARRRQETIEEILAIADDVMTEEGVNGLSLSEVARRLGVKPPDLPPRCRSPAGGRQQASAAARSDVRPSSAAIAIGSM